MTQISSRKGSRLESIKAYEGVSGPAANETVYVERKEPGKGTKPRKYYICEYEEEASPKRRWS